MHRLRTVTLLDISAVAGHHAMPAALLFFLFYFFAADSMNGKWGHNLVVTCIVCFKRKTLLYIAA